MKPWKRDLAYIREVGPDEPRFDAAVQRVWDRCEKTNDPEGPLASDNPTSGEGSEFRCRGEAYRVSADTEALLATVRGGFPPGYAGKALAALRDVDAAFRWIAENYPKAIREMPRELYQPLRRIAEIEGEPAMVVAEREAILRGPDAPAAEIEGEA